MGRQGACARPGRSLARWPMWCGARGSGICGAGLVGRTCAAGTVVQPRHALARLYAEAAKTDPAFETEARRHLARSREITPGLDPMLPSGRP